MNSFCVLKDFNYLTVAMFMDHHHQSSFKT
jgi:hypothetical protein